MYIVGVGPCTGLLQLEEILNRQHGTHVTYYEDPASPWHFDEVYLRQHMTQWIARDSEFVGDIAHYHLNYIPDLIDIFGDNIRVIGVCEAVGDDVRTLLHKYPNKNPFVHHCGAVWDRDEIIDKSYPNYDDELFETASYDFKHKAIQWYVQLYREVMKQFDDRFEQFDLFHAGALKSAADQLRLLKFVGIKSTVLA